MRREGVSELPLEAASPARLIRKTKNASLGASEPITRERRATHRRDDLIIDGLNRFNY